MPEGPSIVIIRDALKPIFTGKKIMKASGNASIDMDALTGKKINSIRSWGKHLLLCFDKQTVRVHFLMFGTYSIDKKIRGTPSIRLALKFATHRLYFYTCAVRLLEGAATTLYDWETDVLSPKWNAPRARRRVKKLPDTLVCDVLLDQEIFAGVGNIIKNEVLFRIKVHPGTRVGDLPPRKLSEMVKEASVYSYDFLHWKREYTLRKHWLVYGKKKCPDCDTPMQKTSCGNTKRRTFFCPVCQIKYE